MVAYTTNQYKTDQQTAIKNLISACKQAESTTTNFKKYLQGIDPTKPEPEFKNF